MHAPAAARSGCKLRPLIAANAERNALLELRRERGEATHEVKRDSMTLFGHRHGPTVQRKI